MPATDLQKLSRSALVAFASMGADAAPVFAQGYTVGGSRPSQHSKLKLHAELAVTPDQRSAALPKIGLALPANPSLEIGIDVQTKHIDRNDSRRISGVGDIEFKAKQLLLDAKRNALGIDASAELKISLPLGDARRGMGEGEPAIKLPITFSRKSGPWEFGGLIGAQAVRRRDKAMLLAGALVTREVGGGFKVGGEMATEMRLRSPRRQELMANAGLRYAPRRSMEIFVIAGRSVATRDDRPVMKFKLGFEIKFNRKETDDD